MEGPVGHCRPCSEARDPQGLRLEGLIVDHPRRPSPPAHPKGVQAPRASSPLLPRPHDPAHRWKSTPLTRRRQDSPLPPRERRGPGLRIHHDGHRVLLPDLQVDKRLEPPLHSRGGCTRFPPLPTPYPSQNNGHRDPRALARHHLFQRAQRHNLSPRRRHSFLSLLLLSLRRRQTPPREQKPRHTTPPHRRRLLSNHKPSLLVTLRSHCSHRLRCPRVSRPALWWSRPGASAPRVAVHRLDEHVPGHALVYHCLSSHHCHRHRRWSVFFFFFLYRYICCTCFSCYRLVSASARPPLNRVRVAVFWAYEYCRPPGRWARAV